MNSSIEISPQLWNWYVTFFISMGWVLAAAVSFVSAMVFIDGLYLYAKKIETKPTPSSYWSAHFNLSRFQAAVGGVLLAPFLGIALYYFLFFMVWNLAPQQVNAPPLDFEELGFGEQIRSIASLLLYLIALALVLVCTMFFLLYCWTGRIVTKGKAAGWGEKILRRYFRENLLACAMMALVAIPVVVYFLYDLSLLLMVILPAIRRNIGRIAFPGGENVYLGMVTLLSAWIAVLILIPAVVLLLRGVKLKWRYIVENPAMHRIFQRQVKWSIFSLLGGTGCYLMCFLSVFAFEHMIWAFMK